MKRKFRILLIALLWLNISCAQKQTIEIDFKSVNTSEADSIRTLKSIKKSGNLYMMTFYGDYNRRLDKVDQQIIHSGLESVRTLKGSNFECSMFAAFATNQIYGRNFDNPECGVLICIYQPPDGYASIGFSRMNDFGFNKDDDPSELPLEKRRLLLNAPFFTPDGMNEHGVAVALAALRGVKIKIDKNSSKAGLFIRVHQSSFIGFNEWI